MTPDPARLLPILERYYDTAPRALCDIEEVGPFTLFVRREGFPYYARPRLGLEGSTSSADVEKVLRRQRELDVPQSLEWVHETTPSLLDAARSAGLSVLECPLLVLTVDPPVPPPSPDVRVLSPEDPDLPLVWAAISVGFANLGTAIGESSIVERDAEAGAGPLAAERLVALIEAGLTVLVGAFEPDVGPVGGGSHNPREDVTEIVGVAVLPAFRRRGLAAAITGRLARNAVDNGVETVFCSAADEAVARIYEFVGFRRVGTACIADVA